MLQAVILSPLITVCDWTETLIKESGVKTRLSLKNTSLIDLHHYAPIKSLCECSWRYLIEPFVGCVSGLLIKPVLLLRCFTFKVYFVKIPVLSQYYATLDTLCCYRSLVSFTRKALLIEVTLALKLSLWKLNEISSLMVEPSLWSL